MEFNAKVEELDSVLAYIEGELEKIDAPMKAVMQLNIAVEEIFVNIAHYAYGEDNIGGYSDITLNPIESGVEVILSDKGVAFDPLAKLDPDVTLNASERNIGGLGIYMVKKSMDQVSYRRENDMNIFSMKKTW